MSTKFVSNRLYLNEKQVAEITGFSTFTLRNNRHKRTGIPYLKIGRNVRYLPADVEQFMEKRRIAPEE